MMEQQMMNTTGTRDRNRTADKLDRALRMAIAMNPSLIDAKNPKAPTLSR